MPIKNFRIFLTRTAARNHTARLLLSFLICFLLFPCPISARVAGQPSQDQLTKQYAQAKAYYQGLRKGARKENRENWLTCVTAFRSIYKAAPEHEVGTKSLFMLGKVYHDMFRLGKNPLDLSEAIAYYEDIPTLFPKHRLADDALFALGIIHATDKNDPGKAGKIYAKIIALYPDGDMAAGASRQLQELKTTVAAPPLPGEDGGEPPAVITITPQAAKTVTDQEQPEAASESAAAGSTGRMATVLPIRHWSNSRYTRVVVETSEPVKFKHQLLPSNGDVPGRLYIDLQDSRLCADIERNIPIQDGLLRQVRNAQYDPTTVRVVLDTQTTISDYKVFNLSEPSRVVIDVMGGEEKSTPKNTKDDALSLVRQLGLGVKRIVLDPGHGGKDPGTTSPSGMKEKDIVLDVALMVAKRLRESLGCEVILTRDRDVFIPLEERTAIANAKEADLFLSIHVNAAPSKEAHGIETYVLDLATNKDAMRVAALENATSARQVSDLQSILMDLMYNSKINESLKLAEIVQDEMITGLNKQYRPVNNLGVKKAPFVVLIGAQMPSILTEIAFLSNPVEEKRLKSGKYLASVADHISSGIGQYVQNMNLASNYRD
ncbi:N-acetylmuramoyl-L-alanine amidase [Thiovibrio sp. JS02]